MNLADYQQILLYFSSYKDKKFSEQQTMQFFAQPVFKD
jgi:hypothetical protein